MPRKKAEPKPPAVPAPPIKQPGSVKQLAGAAGMDVNAYVQLVLKHEKA